MTAETDIADARRALDAIPRFSDEARSAIFVRLGGLTNRVFKVSTGSGNYCLRLPGAGTEAYINRNIEKANAEAAAAAGVSPQVVHFGDDGVMVTRFIEGSKTMTAEEFHENAGRRRACRRGLPRAPRQVEAVRVPLRAVLDDRRLSQASCQSWGGAA